MLVLTTVFFSQPHTLDDDFAEVQKAVISGRVSTVVPIEIARRNQNPIVREELLLRTDVNQEEGSVYWHGLRLLVLDLSWIRKIHWVKRLRLARNGFRSIPNEIGGYLKQVRNILNLSKIIKCSGDIVNFSLVFSSLIGC